MIARLDFTVQNPPIHPGRDKDTACDASPGYSERSEAKVQQALEYLIVLTYGGSENEEE